ncbi:hypothetical protein ACFSTD_23075 [Novosphingobium colocasiae]
MRTGLANLHRPGAQTGALVTALGFGLTAFVMIAGVQTSLDGNIRKTVPQRAPDLFVIDVPRTRAEAFVRQITAIDPAARVRLVPNLRGRILAYGPAGRMTRVADLPEIPDDAWALSGERGLTYSQDVPEGNVVTAGAWWPKDYNGEPLVSVDEDFAKAVGLTVGGPPHHRLARGRTQRADRFAAADRLGSRWASISCWCSRPMRLPMRRTIWPPRSRFRPANRRKRSCQCWCVPSPPVR